MPTQSTTYNSRVTDESLEKRFRDTFRSQGGAELVDDLYAQGVIVPVVDFTAAATGDTLAENLQTAWDFTTGFNSIGSATTTIISNAGFWLIDVNVLLINGSTAKVLLEQTVGGTQKTVFQASNVSSNTISPVTENKFVVFVNSGQVVKASNNATQAPLNVWYRQIATVNGDLVNPSGFTSS